MKRKIFLASGLGAALSACAPIGTKLNENAGFHAFLQKAEALNEGAIGTRGLVREYRPSDVSADFPLDSLPVPTDSNYTRMIAGGFASYRLAVNGLVERPQTFSLSELHALAHLSQITRHDCVEGWSAIAAWDGVRLSELLALVRPSDRARYVVFHSFDRDANGTPYYESLNLHQAAHPQTMLALRQNGKRIAVDRGAPVRLRIPTQLGYKSAKWVSRIELVASLNGLYGGGGGYWEDQGYEWYAGI